MSFSGRPTLIFKNARIATMQADRPTATWLGVAGDGICAVGDDHEVFACGEARVIDCRGLALLPGFIDAHAHVLATAVRAGMVDCGLESIEEIVDSLREAASRAEGNGWLQAAGYHEALLKERRHPDRCDLDRASRDRPIRLRHASGHASVLNSEAMRALGIDRAFSEPDGAAAGRNSPSGELSGVFLEMEDWLDSRMPKPSIQELKSQVRKLSERLLSLGVTSVQDLGHRNDAGRGALFGKLIDDGDFRPRLTLATGYAAFHSGETAAGGKIQQGPVKFMVNESGEVLEPDPVTLRVRVAEIHQSGHQVAIHAIEPRAIDAAISAIEAAQAVDGRQGRHRIEHASITTHTAATRMSRAGIIAVSNPAFLYASGDRYLATINPERLGCLYDVAGLRAAGVTVAAGSDCPVAPPDPAIGILGATQRTTASGRRIPGATLALDEAMELFTSAAAYAAFEETERGTIAPGRLADFVLVEQREHQMVAAMTVLGGEVVWQSETSGIAIGP
jgi:predicted amidohydrolase YtcJ